MGKAYKNIDDLFQSNIGTDTAKAPAHVKATVMSKLGGSNWWILGAAMLFITALSAILISINMPTNNIKAVYNPRSNSEDLTTEKYALVKAESSQYLATNKSKGIDQNTGYPETVKTAANIESEAAAVIDNKPISTPQSKQLRTRITSRSTTNAIAPNAKAPLLAKNHSAAKTDSKSAGSPKQLLSGKNELTTDKIARLTAKNETSQTIEEPVQETRSTVNDSTDAFSKSQEKTNSQALTTTASHANLPEIEEPLVTDSHISSSTDSSFAQISTSEESNNTTTQQKGTDTLADHQTIEIDLKPSEKKGQWALGVSVGPSINNVNYGNSETGLSLSKFHNEKLGYSAQLFGQYMTHNKIVSTLGIGYETMAYNTTFLTTQTITTINETSVFSHYVYDSLNTIIDTIYTSQFDTTETTDLENHYGIAQQQYLQIPLSLGYQIEKNKWVFGADLGIQINYLLKAGGSYFQNNLVNELSTNSILKRTVINYSIGGNLQYNIYNNVFVLGQVRYSPALQNYYNSTYGNRSINAVALKIGLTVKL
jgi:hypothetical protein